MTVTAQIYMCCISYSFSSSPLLASTVQLTNVTFTLLTKAPHNSFLVLDTNTTLPFESDLYQLSTFPNFLHSSSDKIVNLSCCNSCEYISPSKQFLLQNPHPCQQKQDVKHSVFALHQGQVRSLKMIKWTMPTTFGNLWHLYIKLE